MTLSVLNIPRSSTCGHKLGLCIPKSDRSFRVTILTCSNRLTSKALVRGEKPVGIDGSLVNPLHRFERFILLGNLAFHELPFPEALALGTPALESPHQDTKQPASR